MGVGGVAEAPVWRYKARETAAESRRRPVLPNLAPDRSNGLREDEGAIEEA